MAQLLHSLEVDEVSLVDRPANSEMVNGKKVPRAVVAIWKRDGDDGAWSDDDPVCKAVEGKTQDGTKYPKSDFAYAPDDVPSHWKLRLTSSPGGKPDPAIVGAAVAALGKGFRGRKVQIPSSALAGAKAKVRAAWRAANPDKGDDELPEVLKKGEEAMTMEDIEKRQTQLEGSIAAVQAENAVLKRENEAVLKMNRAERELYAGMSADVRKAFLDGDESVRKGLLEKADAQKREADLVAKMDAPTKAKYDAAGPAERAEILKACSADMEERAKKKAPKAKADDKPYGGEETEEEEEMEDEEETTEKKAKCMKTESVSKAEVASLMDRVAKAEGELASVRKRERVAKFERMAEAELPHSPGTAAEKGARVMKLADALGEDTQDFKDAFDVLKAADKNLALGFAEVGKAGGAVPAEKAWDAAVEKIAKRDGISIPKATGVAMSEHPDLYLDIERAHGRA